MNILDEIAEKTRQRVADAKNQRSLEDIRQQALSLVEREKSWEFGFDAPFPDFPFERALAAPGMSFICEVKRASPSKGMIAEDFPFLQIAREYEQAGAAAVSCLTEPFWFKGSDDYLRRIAQEVSIPVLRKDFVVDEYMIYEAKVLGAKAVLLICAILDDLQLRDYLRICDELGLSALVEAHDKQEIVRAVSAGARVIGVNNRDLRTFTVDLRNSLRLRSYVPPNALFVSESGITCGSNVAELADYGTDAVLVGERLMRADDKKAMLDRLRDPDDGGEQEAGA